jgi:neutral ceramidase
MNKSHFTRGGQKLPKLTAACISFLIATAMLLNSSTVHAQELPWRVGVARINVTPEKMMWLSGYGERDRPAVGKRHELWAKALVVEDDAGEKGVLVTIDVVGIPRDFSQRVCREIAKRHGLPRSAIALVVSHTHTGPVIDGNLMPMSTGNPQQLALIESHSEKLAKDILKVVDNAFKCLRPAALTWGTSEAAFAVNRRNNPEPEVPQRKQNGQLLGPVDHEVPVLIARDAEGQAIAVVGGYACHATVLNDYLWSGDWPGAGMIELESRHEGLTGFFCPGCGGDQNPLPRRKVELMNDYGRQFADAIDEALDIEATHLAATLRTEYREIDAPFAKLPTRPELELAAKRSDAEGAWARQLLAQWDAESGLPETYPYPIQVWRLGDRLNWVFLGGEVVVDYSLRIKSELGPNVWVAAYANDVMGYIPSRRVLKEGGYEGATSRIGYGLPAVWAPEIEEVVVQGVRDAVARVERPVVVGRPHFSESKDGRKSATVNSKL